jgi:hypothetical protein
VRDATEGEVSISKKWHDARDKHREALIALEGAESFEGVQRFLEVCHSLVDERRLSRFMYLAAKPA